MGFRKPEVDPIDEIDERKPGFALSKEQTRIVERHVAAKDPVLLGLARAGAGKTTTALACLRARKEKAAYVSFALSGVNAVKPLMPEHATAMTSHAMAWRIQKKGKPLGLLYSDRLQGFGALRRRIESDIVRGHRFMRPYDLANLIGSCLARFTFSADERVGSQHIPEIFRHTHIEQHGSRTAEITFERVVELTQATWDRIVAEGSDWPATHDVYLKVAQLGLRSGELTLPYDLVVFDEAQDANPAALDMLRSAVQKGTTRLLAIGDPAQAIYEWRLAIDAFKALEGHPVLPLQQSWRYGQEVADWGRRMLALRVDEPMDLHGLGSSRVHMGLAPARQGLAIISRTNAAVIASALDALSQGYPVRIVSPGMTATLNMVEDIAELMAGGKAKGRELSMFDSWDALIRHVESLEKTGNLEAAPLSAAIHLVKKLNLFGREAIRRTIREPIESCLSEHNPSLICGTAHALKGQEFDAVELGDDWNKVPIALESRDGSSWVECVESANLFYVAMTRAQSHLYLGAVIEHIEEDLQRLTQEHRDPQRGMTIAQRLQSIAKEQTARPSDTRVRSLKTQPDLFEAT